MKLQRALTRLRHIYSTLIALNEDLDEIKINQGRILAKLNATERFGMLKDYEFKVFSQWGEDGILQYLTRAVAIKNRTFIEFGVEDFTESNCRLLLLKDNWEGFVIDSSEANVAKIKRAPYSALFHLDAAAEFITRENVNELLKRSGFDEDLGVLSVDIDGNDYHVLEAITAYRPRILVCEYNAVFGADRAITVPYDDGFDRTAKHHSNLYFGASLPAVTHLAKSKGYTIVGANSNGVNAFFVRNDLMTEELAALHLAHTFQPSRFRESRDKLGNLTRVSGDARLQQIKGMPVIEVISGSEELL